MPTEFRLLYIGGESRSGTTILEKALGGSPNVVSVGETRYLLKRGMLEGEPCGCGVALNQCEFWTEVLRNAFGKFDQADATRWLQIQRAVDPPEKFVATPVALRGESKLETEQAKEYTQFLSKLYESMASVSGKSVILESSKSPATAHVIRKAVGSVAFSMLHVTRHPSAVAYSLTRKKKWPSSNVDAVMSTYPWHRAAVRWLVVNRLLRKGDFGQSRAHLSYEEFTSAPKASLQRVLESLDMDLNLDHIEQNMVEMSATHSVSGNPSRFSVGQVEIREDATWQTELNWRIKASVTGITSPEKHYYGY